MHASSVASWGGEREERAYFSPSKPSKERVLAEKVLNAWEKSGHASAEDTMMQIQAMRVVRSIMSAVADTPFQKGFLASNAMTRMQLNPEMQAACRVVLQEHFGNQIDFETVETEPNPFARIADETRFRADAAVH